MHKFFSAYYQPTEQDFAEMWRTCIFAFDTSSLLNIHQYSSEAQEHLFDILRQLRDRIWMPYQVGLEYHRNRLDAVDGQVKLYDGICAQLSRALEKADTQPSLFSEHSRESLKNTLTAFQAAKVDRSKLLSENHVTTMLAELFGDNIGEPYPEERLEELYVECGRRFERQVPPGYKDKNDKPIPDRYGDVIVWFQLIDHGRATHQPIVFITDEKKEDWWRHDEKGEIISPRPELLQEMFLKAGVKSYIYRSDSFIKYADAFLQQPVQAEIIEEVVEAIQQVEEQKQLEEVREQQRKVLRRQDIDRLLQEQHALNRSTSAYIDRLLQQQRDLDRSTSAYAAAQLWQQQQDLDRVVYRPSDIGQLLQQQRELDRTESAYADRDRLLERLNNLEQQSSRQQDMERLLYQQRGLEQEEGDTSGHEENESLVKGDTSGHEENESLVKDDTSQDEEDSPLE